MPRHAVATDGRAYLVQTVASKLIYTMETYKYICFNVLTGLKHPEKLTSIKTHE